MQNKNENQQFDPVKLVFEMLKDLKERPRSVIIKRFNLDGKGEKTLEEIGKELGVTRERVRQIQSEALKKLSKAAKSGCLNPIFGFIQSTLAEGGNLMTEDFLLKSLLRSKNISKVSNKRFLQKQSLLLILSLSDLFIKVKKTKTLKCLWIIDKSSLELCEAILGDLEEYLKKNQKVMDDKAILRILKTRPFVKKNIDKLSDKVLLNWISASQKIIKSPLGKWGLKSNFQISPRGVKDKAYLVLQKEKKPLHFTKITQLINQTWPKDRKARSQTVHNELIKDERCVLVGRGIYALGEWGYHRGTVLEVLQQVLSEKGSLSFSREDLVKEVLKRRLVKRNTVLLNLQNTDYFIKLNNGKYKLKDSKF